jgi:hypothetical protein
LRATPHSYGWKLSEKLDVWQECATARGKQKSNDQNWKEGDKNSGVIMAQFISALCFEEDE